jgi:hypothetical protein
MDIAIYNLQHTNSYIICISSSIAQHTHHISPINIYNIKSFNKIYEIAGGGRGLGWSLKDYFLQVRTSLELWSSSVVGATTITFLRAPPLSSFRPPPSVWHWYSEPVWCCPSSPAEVLSRWKPVCFLTFESKNERIHLVIILNKWNLEAMFIWAHVSVLRALIVVARGCRGGVTQACQRRRRSHHPYLHRVIRWSLLLARGGGAVRRRLELPTSCIREGGGAMQRRLELLTSCIREGGGAMQLEGEANLP